MVAIPFPTTSAPGRRPHESSGRLINACRRNLPAGARAPYVIARAPGIAQWAATGFAGYRGSLLVNSTLYTAMSGEVVSFAAGSLTSGGSPTTVGALAGTSKVTWARNNKSPTPDVIVVDPANGPFVVTSGSVTAYNASGNLPAVNSVSFLDGYLLFTVGDGRAFASDLNATTVNPLNFTLCDAHPGGLIRGIAFGQEWWAWGPKHCEVFSDTANPTAFPFSRVTVIPRGLMNAFTITGFEEGIGKGIVLLGDDGIVYALNGYMPEKISTPDVDAAVTSYLEGGGNSASLEMFSFVVDGHSRVALNSPSFTWVYDLDTLDWFERQSWNATILASPWRATGPTVNAFGAWICGDTQSGNLGRITDSVAQEFGNPLIYTVESGPVTDFPERMAVPMASFDIARGVGIATGHDPDQTNPVGRFYWTDNGGVSWKGPKIRPLGQQGQAKGNQIKVAKTGMTQNQGRRWKIVVSDAVDVELTGGDMTPEVRE